MFQNQAEISQVLVLKKQRLKNAIKTQHFLTELVFAWVLSRIIILAALFVVRKISYKIHIVSGRLHLIISSGLNSWDAGYYTQIAIHGYGASKNPSLRFFPLYPLMGHFVGYFLSFYSSPLESTKLALLIIANSFALLTGFIIYRLTLFSLQNESTAKKAFWIYFFSPASFVTVMAYPEPVFDALVGLYLIGTIKKSAWLTGLAGVLAALCRPTGVLLFSAGLVEGLKILRHNRSVKSFTNAAIYLVSPIIGAVLYLFYCMVKYHDFLAPVTIQLSAKHRGRFVNPITNVYDKILGGFHGHLDGIDHVFWIIVVAYLIIFYFRYIPVSWLVLVIATFVVAIASSNLDGFERYILDGIPIVILAAKATEKGSRFVPVMVFLSCLMILYFILAMFGLYVP